MTDLIFADLSNFQATVDFAQLRGYSAAVGEEISWGTAVTIPSGRIAAIRAEAFTCVLWYMGLRSDQDIASQVNTFTATLGSLNAGETVVIDWEESFGSTPSVSQREQAASLLAAYYKCDPAMIGTYGPASLLKASPPPSWVWAASYETTEPQIPHAIWQFTDGFYTSPPYSPVNFPGVGACDASVYHGTAEQLAALISPVSHPAPGGDDVPLPMLSPIVEFSGIDHQFDIGSDGQVWHHWRALPDGFAPEHLPMPAGVTAAGGLQVVVEANVLFVYVVGSDNLVYVNSQVLHGVTWSGFIHEA